MVVMLWRERCRWVRISPNKEIFQCATTSQVVVGNHAVP